MDTHTHTHTHTHTNTHSVADADEDSCTQSAERSQLTACEKKIFEEDMLPVAMEHSHTYTWCSVNPKETRATAHLWTQRRTLDENALTQSIPVALKTGEGAAATFKSIAATIIALVLCAYALSCMYWRGESTFQEQYCFSGYSHRTV